MKIISNFKDYYDGINPSMEPFWKRVTREVELDTAKKSELSLHQQEFCTKSFLQLPLPDVENPLVDDFYTIKVLGFCGKLYPLYEMRYNDTFTTYFNIEKFVNDYNKLSYKKKPNNYQSLYYHGRRLAYYNHSFIDILSPEQWEIEFQQKEYVDQLFIDLKTPIFIIHKEHFRNRRIVLEANPCLKDYGVHKLFDVYSLYQMIEQYLSNELVTNNNKPDTITDEIKRDKHGFYDMSFKNEGHKRKSKRKRK